MTIGPGARRLWSEWLQPIILVIVIATSFRSAIADWNDVPTGSMKPTILEGDRIFVNKLAYDLRVPYTLLRLASWGHPDRGDIVVLYSPETGCYELPAEHAACLTRVAAPNNISAKAQFIGLLASVEDRSGASQDARLGVGGEG